MAEKAAGLLRLMNPYCPPTRDIPSAFPNPFQPIKSSLFFVKTFAVGTFLSCSVLQALDRP